MKFKFLYVDDEINDIQRIREAVQEHNKENNLVELIMLGDENVERLREQLSGMQARERDQERLLRELNLISEYFETNTEDPQVEQLLRRSRDTILEMTGPAPGRCFVCLRPW